MKKVLICGVIAAAFGMTSAFAAGTAVDNFNVKATVNAQCQAINPTPVPEVNFGAVTAFAAASATANLQFQCTKGLAISTVTLSKTASTVAGFAYTLGVDTGTKVAGSAASGTTGATADQWTYVVTGTIASGQPGDTGAATSDPQTLTIGF